ncbi:hypothetical protein OSB04_017526 [Centaurea solstitialis]|uniref:Reverse transcriptase domain-containing protein n=1 Tax=Centaurea solstitialis TaxID=347529 RepID=A0AA38TE11_9ASTR|nr:hypothetical protein OSB04_017526 [Centaurea solstitialis]
MGLMESATSTDSEEELEDDDDEGSISPSIWSEAVENSEEEEEIEDTWVESAQKNAEVNVEPTENIKEVPSNSDQPNLGVAGMSSSAAAKEYDSTGGDEGSIFKKKEHNDGNSFIRSDSPKTGKSREDVEALVVDLGANQILEKEGIQNVIEIGAQSVKESLGVGPLMENVPKTAQLNQLGSNKSGYIHQTQSTPNYPDSTEGILSNSQFDSNDQSHATKSKVSNCKSQKVIVKGRRENQNQEIQSVPSELELERAGGKTHQGRTKLNRSEGLGGGKASFHLLKKMARKNFKKTTQKKGSHSSELGKFALKKWNDQNQEGTSKHRADNSDGGLNGESRLPVVGIQETKVKVWTRNQVRNLWGGDEVEFARSEARGNSEGIITMWDKRIFVSTTKIEDPLFVAVIGNWKGKEGLICFVNVYGPNVLKERVELWKKLESLTANFDVNWCIFGDFNEVRGVTERQNSSTNRKGADEFNDFISRSNLVEVPLIGRRFTRVSGDGLKFSKLDRFLISTDFGTLWKGLGVRALDRKWSDHTPIMLFEDFRDFGPKPFKFFDSWLEEEEVSLIVQNAWLKEVASIKPDGIFRDKLKNVKNDIKEWAKKKFGKLDYELEKAKDEALKKELGGDNHGWDDSERERWVQARKKWLELEKRKVDMDRQKAKIKWATDGGENSKMFHIAIKHRERKNLIRGIQASNGWTEDPEEIKDRVYEFFKKKDQFKKEKYWEAIKNCGSNKSPGLDGFTFGFLKKFWPIINADLSRAVNWFWEKGELSKGCNASFLTLIPKTESPLNLGDYRPISLIGAFYKIIAKIMAERLKGLMGKINNNTQSAFIKDRFILDGVLIVNEVIDFLKRKKKKGLIFKVDFEKAYDSVEWSFLLDCMRKMGFGEKWVKRIEECLKSSTTSVLVNGSPTKEFPMRKGLRQGDPLAPFLFLIVAEALHLLTEKAEDNLLFEGIKVGNQNLPVSHLQYADDVVFLGQWRTSNLKNLLKILECFQRMSGLKINVSKSKNFGVGVPDEEVSSWATSVGCKYGKLPFSYLGLPVGNSMRKIDHWKEAIGKIKKRLNSWKARFVSFGGRLTLVKSVLGSLPLYYFSLFRAPNGVIKECTTWTAIIQVGTVLDNQGIDFSGSFAKKIGDEKKTFMWEERWNGSARFKDTFPRLYQLEEDKQAHIADRGMWTEEGWRWTWSWRRPPRGRELGELEDLTNRLAESSPIRDKSDVIEWKLDDSKEYKVKRMQELQEEVEPSTSPTIKTKWNKIVPKKVCILAWRARLGRLPCRVSLDRMGIDLDSILCPRCGDESETLDHTLVTCPEVKKLWCLVGNWWNKNLERVVSTQEILQLGEPAGEIVKEDDIWTGTKWSIMYLIWEHRNAIVFKENKNKLLDKFFEFQRRTFEWITRRVRKKNTEWGKWLVDPKDL